jgi:membrane protease YdiL (CAAX protease family)
MKSYLKIIILLLSAMLVTVFVSPIVADILDFHLYKIMSRVMLLSVLILFINYKYAFGFQSIKELGFEFNRKWWKLTSVGYLLGLLSIGLILFIMVLNTIRFVVPNLSYKELLESAIQYFFAGLFVAFFEELLFRGFIFQSLLKDSGIVFSIFFTNIIYALVHFLRPAALEKIGVLSFFSSLNAVPVFFSPLISDFNHIWSSAIGLFLVGAVLSVAYLRTRNLAMSIGLHASWVLAIKSVSVATDATTSGVLWMSGTVVENPITWIILTLFLFLLRWSGPSIEQK